jgi:hypothetical protein
MKIVLTLLSFSMLMFTLGWARPQQQASGSCGFTVEGEPAHPTITGPDDILPLVYMVEQPDSPIEFVSVDLSGMWLSILNGQSNDNTARRTGFVIGATVLSRESKQGSCF